MANPTNSIYRSLTIGSLLISAVTLAGCVVPKSDYEDLQTQNKQLQGQVQQLQTQNQQLKQQVSAQSAQICRLQGAIKYTVNSDLLFPSGKYQMSAQGKQIAVDGILDRALQPANLRRLRRDLLLQLLILRLELFNLTLELLVLGLEIFVVAAGDDAPRERHGGNQQGYDRHAVEWAGGRHGLPRH